MKPSPITLVCINYRPKVSKDYPTSAWPSFRCHLPPRNHPQNATSNKKAVIETLVFHPAKISSIKDFQNLRKDVVTEDFRRSTVTLPSKLPKCATGLPLNKQIHKAKQKTAKEARQTQLVQPFGFPTQPEAGPGITKFGQSAHLTPKVLHLTAMSNLAS